MAIAASLLAVPPAPAHAVTAGTRELAFTSSRDGDTEIFRRTSTGSVVQLTVNRANDFNPTWAPDGRRLAFVSDRDGDDEIYVMRADGSGVRQLTHNNLSPDGGLAGDFAPAWSPDGRRIAFSSTRSGGAPEIWVMRADGSQLRRLTRTAIFVGDYTPRWSPDGCWIAFSSDRAGHESSEIYRMRPDGSNVQRLTPTADGVDETAPDWSPDGRHISYSADPLGQQDLFVMNADGSGARRLAGDPVLDDVFARWTADGRHLMYFTFSGFAGTPSADVWLVRSDGTRRHRIISTSSDDSFPDPRPVAADVA
jgi:TolB protein